MISTRKLRLDSRLKTLPPERQAEIMEYLASHTILETTNWLREAGMAISTTPVSEFRSWYLLREQSRRNEATVQTLLGELMKQDPALTTERVQAVGQAFFTALALERQDPKAWELTQKIALRKERLQLQQKQFQRDTCALFLEWLEDKQAKEIAAGAGSNADKIERLGKLMFGADWK